MNDAQIEKLLLEISLMLKEVTLLRTRSEKDIPLSGCFLD